MHFYALFALPCRTINDIYKGYIDLNILLAYSYAIVTNKTAAVRFQRFANHRRIWESPGHRTILDIFFCVVTNCTGPAGVCIWQHRVMPGRAPYGALSIFLEISRAPYGVPPILNGWNKCPGAVMYTLHCFGWRLLQYMLLLMLLLYLLLSTY